MPARRSLPIHGWIGLVLVGVSWTLNWSLEGLRTHLGFFPLWLGYCLAVDGLNVRLRGTSLATRNVRAYGALFLISVPAWWLFEAINLRTANWSYVGREHFSDAEYALLASLSFSTVVPAVLGTAELVAGRGGVRRLRGRGAFPRGRGTAAFFVTGVSMLALTLAWPAVFYPFVWLSLFFLIEPLNHRLGFRTLIERTRRGDWREVGALFVGVLVCGFFWELWNYGSYPKWVYHVPGLGFAKLFEMPALGYLGYLPFSLELFALTHLAFGLAGHPRSDYVVAGLTRDGDDG